MGERRSLGTTRGRTSVLSVLLALTLGACTSGGSTTTTEVPGPTVTTEPTATTSAPVDTTTTPESPSMDGVVIIGETNPPNTFDPIGHSNLNNWFVWQLAYEGLVEAQPDGSIVPLLAESWEVSDDGLTYTFSLRPGVLFHNGQPLESDDVIYTFERLQTQGIPYAQARFPNLESVTPVDEMTVEFRLTSPDSSFLTNLADPFAVANSILNREAGASAQPAVAMVGTGPYKSVSYAPERELVMQANEHYWREGLPIAPNLIIRYLPEQSAQVAALRAGQIHLMFPTPETALVLESEPNVELRAVPTAQTFQINMGSDEPPLDDVRVRRAIALSIDREELVALALLGAGAPTGPFPPGHPWAVPVGEQPYYQRDVAAARALLAEAGYPDGLELSFMWPAGFDQVGDRIGEILQPQLAESGITLVLEPLETPAWLDKLVTANYDLTWTAPSYFADPRQYVIPRDGRQGPTPPELAELFTQAQAATDATDLAELYRAIQLMEADLVYPFTGLMARDGWVAFRSDLLSGVEVDYTLSRRLFFNLVPAG
jgi:peptide/nickel transport system substrate-binding protein